jgi:FkbM family methyltransferase
MRIIKIIIYIIIKLYNKKYSYRILGSEYGGWAINTNLPPFSNVISCAVGEDISYEIEFLNKYKGKIYLVDPTPRALAHYKGIKNNFGNKKKTNYTKDGNQPISSYDLSNINSNNLTYINKAIWIKNKKLKFYSPKNKDHVSFSIFIDKNRSGKFIKVNSTDISSIIKKFSIKNIEIMKLDIEGVELLIIENLFNKNIFPKQILFEFDQLKNNSLKSFFYLFKFVKLIRKFKYDIFYNDLKYNFSIIKRVN